MDPFTLISIGSSIIRTFSGDSRLGKAADAVAGVIDAARGDPEAVRRGIETLPPEVQVRLEELQLEATKVAAVREKERLDAIRLDRELAQEAWKAEMKHTDAYVRRTRPKLARLSVYVGLTYGFALGVVFPLLNAVSSYFPEWAYIPTLPEKPDPWVLSALFSPAGFYITARTADAFSRNGKN